MRERTLHTGPRGLNLRLCEWGQRDDRLPVLILHGFLEQGAAWHAVAQRLDRYVVAPDHRGHGHSDHVSAGGFYHFWDYLPDVAAVVDDLGGRVDLVGHSMGGTMAALFAATCPARVRRLVLIEGLGPSNMADQALARPRHFLNALRSPPTHRPVADLSDAAARIRRWTPGMSPETALRLAERASRPLSDDERDAANAGPEARLWRWDPLHRARNPIPFRTQDFLPFLGTISAPTLLIDGAKSVLVPQDQQARVAAIEGARRVTLPGGHMLHHDVPHALAATLSADLDQSSEAPGDVTTAPRG